jgi:hypothetical protein
LRGQSAALGAIACSTVARSFPRSLDDRTRADRDPRTAFLDDRVQLDKATP